VKRNRIYLFIFEEKKRFTLLSSPAAHRLGTNEKAVDEPDRIVALSQRTQNKVDRNRIPRGQTCLQPRRKEAFFPVKGIFALLYRLQERTNQSKHSVSKKRGFGKDT
jgi:hypothetical protein